MAQDAMNWVKTRLDDVTQRCPEPEERKMVVESPRCITKSNAVL